MLLDTIKSRCQLIRFNCFSKKQAEIFLKNNFEPTKLNIFKSFTSQDLINSANGSPNDLLEIIKVWNELSDKVTDKLNLPLKDNLEILKISKLISEKLDPNQQILLVHLLQEMWWRKTGNINFVKKLENLSFNIKNNVQPKFSWEITLLKIAFRAYEIESTAEFIKSKFLDLKKSCFAFSTCPPKGNSRQYPAP